MSYGILLHEHPSATVHFKFWQHLLNHYTEKSSIYKKKQLDVGNEPYLSQRYYLIFWVMNYFPLLLVQSGQTDGQTESDAYEPTVQFAQVGSKNLLNCIISLLIYSVYFPLYAATQNGSFRPLFWYPFYPKKYHFLKQFLKGTFLVTYFFSVGEY